MSDLTSDFIVVQTTSDDRDTLVKIARQLVIERLAACVQIGGPIESIFQWEGNLNRVQEWTCTLKTTRAAWPRLRQTMLEMHNYDVPEILLLPVADGHDAYLDWIRESVPQPD